MDKSIALYDFIGLAYRKYLHELRKSCNDDEEYMLKKADRAFSPRRPDYNKLYTAYCSEKWGGKNGEKLFDALDSIVDTYIDDNPESLIEMQRYEERMENGKTIIQPFVLSIVTPLMKRVHSLVITLNVNNKFVSCYQTYLLTLLYWPI